MHPIIHYISYHYLFFSLLSIFSGLIYFWSSAPHFNKVFSEREREREREKREREREREREKEREREREREKEKRERERESEREREGERSLRRRQIELREFAFRRVASGDSGPSFGRLAAKVTHQLSFLSTLVRRRAHDRLSLPRKDRRNCHWSKPRLLARTLESPPLPSKPCPGRVVGRQEALAANNSAGLKREVKYSPSYRRLATSYRDRAR